MEILLIFFLLNGAFLLLCAYYFHQRIKAEKSVFPAVLIYVLVLSMPVAAIIGMFGISFEFLIPAAASMLFSAIAWLTASVYLLWKTRSPIDQSYLFSQWMQSWLLIVLVFVLILIFKDIQIGKIGG